MSRNEPMEISDLDEEQLGTRVDGVSISVLVEATASAANYNVSIGAFQHGIKLLSCCTIQDSGSFSTLESLLLQIAPTCDVIINALESAVPKSVRGKVLEVVETCCEDTARSAGNDGSTVAAGNGESGASSSSRNPLNDANAGNLLAVANIRQSRENPTLGGSTGVVLFP